MSSRAGRTVLRSSWEVMRRHRKLLVFPAVSLVGVLLLLAVLFSTAPTGRSWTTFEHWRLLMRSINGQYGGFTLAAPLSPRFMAAILTTMILGTFVNVAMYHELLNVLSGGSVSIRRGFLFACRRGAPILAWSLFASSIGLLIRAVNERLGLLGKLGIEVASVAWGVAAVFVIPVMVREPSANPIRLLKCSMSLVRETWGDTVYGFVGIQLRYLFLPAMLAVILVSVFAAMRAPMLCVPAILALGAYIALIHLVNDIYRCALYVCATEGAAPFPYDDCDMDRGWKIRSTKS